MADANHAQGTGWIWKVFWILLIVTTVEVVLGLIKPSWLEPIVFGTSLLNIVFILLTLFKAYYIVSSFMHLGHERKNFKLMIYLPALILIPYILFIFLTEGVALAG